MLNEWTFFKDVDFNDSTILQYHIDTRDFHCLSNDETPTELPDIYTLKKYNDRFFYTVDEVISLLNHYYTESGGEKKWRFFTLDKMNNWDLKYIRIYRVDDKFIICNDDNYALNKDTTSGEVSGSI